MRLGVRVCTDLGCAMAGSDTLVRDLPRLFGPASCVSGSHCLGRCADAPAAAIGDFVFGPADAELVMSQWLARQSLPAAARGAALPVEAWIDSERYRAEGGFAILAAIACGERDAASAARVLVEAGLPLPGRGADIVVQVHASGVAAMRDEWLFTRDPHRMFDGMLLAAAATGATRLVLHLPRQRPALEEMLARELLAVLGNAPCALPEVAIEESPAPASALDAEPFHWVRAVLEQGSDWFARFGRRGRKGLRVYAVAGRVASPGVKVAPAGLTLLELVDECCDGMQAGSALAGAVASGPGAVLVVGEQDRVRAAGIGGWLEPAAEVQ